MLIASQEFNLLLVEPFGTYTIPSLVENVVRGKVDSDVLNSVSTSNLCT